MRHFIDVNVCCIKGLSIINDKWTAWRAADHRAIVALRKVESDHLGVCSKCNPDLLVDVFFQKVGKVTVKNG
jgi:hypothetical protein